MAITNSNKGAFADSSPPQTWTPSFSIAAGEVGVLSVSVGGATVVSSVSDGTHTWTQIKTITNTAELQNYYWYNNTGSAFTPGFVVTLASNSVKRALVLGTFAGVSTAPIGTSGTAQSPLAGSNSPAISLTTTAANSMVVTAYAMDSQPTITTAGTDTALGSVFTLGGSGANNATNSGQFSNTTTHASGASVGTTGTWSSSGAWAAVAVELLAAAATSTFPLGYTEPLAQGLNPVFRM